MQDPRNWPKVAVFFWMPVLFVAVVACQPTTQQPFNEGELRQLVQEEVRAQAGEFNPDIPGDFGPLKAELELEMMEPLTNLQFELDEVRNQLFGEEYAPRIDLDSLRLDLEQIRADFESSGIEFARRDRLDQLQFEVEGLRNSLDRRDLETHQGSGFHEIRFELEQYQSNMDVAGREFNISLEQLQLDMEDIRQSLQNVETDIFIQLDGLRLLIEAQQ